MLWAEPIAYGPLNISPDKFATLQPGEFYALLAGYKWREERRQTETAYWLAYLLNVAGKSLKKPVRPYDLVKPLQHPAEGEVRQDTTSYLKNRFNID